MCLICIELIKHKMTMGEASGAVQEMIYEYDEDASDYEVKEQDHFEDLLHALQALDLEKLDKLLDEGTKDKL